MWVRPVLMTDYINIKRKKRSENFLVRAGPTTATDRVPNYVRACILYDLCTARKFIREFRRVFLFLTKSIHVRSSTEIIIYVTRWNVWIINPYSVIIRNTYTSVTSRRNRSFSKTVTHYFINDLRWKRQSAVKSLLKILDKL